MDTSHIKSGGKRVKSETAAIRKRSGADRKDNILCWILLAPFLILFGIFVLLPVLSSVVLSFFDYDTVSAPLFIGFQNYLRMFTDDSVFFKVLGNTLKFAVVTGPISFLLAFLLAWLINEFPRTLRGFLAFLFYAPALVGNAYFIWQVAFSGDSFGYVNNFALSFGLITQPIQWLKDTNYNTAIIMIVQLWMSMGVSFLANIAGLQNVNTELYEAGAIDGIRTRWHELWYITLPHMKPQLMFGAVMAITSTFAVGDVTSALCGFPSTDYAAHTVVNHLVDFGTTRFDMGYASAIATILFAVMVGANKAVQKALSKVGS